MDTVVRHGENILWYDVGFTVGYSLRPTQCRLTCHLQRSTAPFCTFSAKNCIENSMVGLEFWPLCNSPHLRGYACMSMMEAGEHPQMIILEPWQIFWIFDNPVALAFDAGSELHSHSSPSCLAWPISQNASKRNAHPEASRHRNCCWHSATNCLLLILMPCSLSKKNESIDLFCTSLDPERLNADRYIYTIKIL